MRKSIFQIGKLVAAPDEGELARPWFILETVFTSDGMRTRLCEGRWMSEDAARAMLEQKESKNV